MSVAVASAVGAPSTRVRLFGPIGFFLVSLIVPFFFMAGSFQLTAYRLVLLVMFVPLTFMWLSKRIRMTDLALLGFCLWTVLSFTAVHGMREGVESGGIMVVETFGAFLMGRVFVRNADDFLATMKIFFVIVLFLLPFAMIESFTTTNLLLSWANAIGEAMDVVPKEPRWGLDRAQGPFSHPILFGVFCGALVSLVYFVIGYGQPLASKFWKTAAVFFTAGLCLSSGPISAVMAQVLMMGWNFIFKFIRQRWLILIGLATSMVIAVEIVAKRSAAEIFIGYFAFSKATAYNRIYIWIYGTQSVANHPWVGIGYNDWERPSYMVSSMDMFWLVPAVRHGIPAALFLQLAFVGTFVLIALHRIESERLRHYRLGFLLCLLGYYVAGWTVHYWGAVYVQLMFLLGSGMWLLDPASEGAGTPAPSRRRIATRQWRVPDFAQRATA